MRNKMTADETKRTISTCGKNRNSTWPGGGSRNTTKGMRMVVTLTNVDGRRYSTTSFESP